MRIKNAEIYNSNRKCFIRADMTVENGRISEILYTGKENGKADKLIVPGFIDIHSHGAFGVDMLYSDCDKLTEMSGYYAKNGVTSLFLTLGSAPHGDIMKAIEEIKKAGEKSRINFAGIHAEGPYINKSRAGAHPPGLIKEPDLAELEEIAAAVLGCGLRLHITVAPELDGAFEFIAAAVKKGATVTLGHTQASRAVLDKAIELGAKSFTHLFNAMTPIHHRDPGVAGYALTSDEVYAEAICDGIHLHPETVNLIYRAKGIEKIITVSDSMAAAGLSDGIYGRTIVENGRAFLKNADGTETIAGSTTVLYKELNNFINFTGCKLEEAILTVTKNPAECTGIYDRKGSLETGKDADFIVLDKDKWDKNREAVISEVYVNGERTE